MAHKIDLFDPASYELPNWAEHIDDEKLKELGRHVCEATKVDAASREPWLADTDMWLDMATQVIETKNIPWPNASSVKFPLLTTAALQFHARAHQELLKGERVVKGKVIGEDPNGDKAKRGKRVESAMTNQLLYRMEDWSDDTDRLLFVLPLVGTVFRKTYWSSLLRRPASELVLANELVVNYYATDWERARKTHTFLKSKNEIVEQVRMLNYLDVDLPDVPAEPIDEESDGTTELPDDMESTSLPEDVPHTILEQHGWYDLDDDGYQEPYIITVEEESQQVLRILPRFLPENIETVRDEILRIIPLEYIVAYKFLPDVDSSIYGIGIGKLLGPSNAAIDTIINQLVDSGTLATMPSGFIGRGVRLSRGGRIRLQPGEWQVVNSTGDDLQRNFFPMPVKEPSQVLFNLLGLLIQAGEKMGSVTEALSGENPGQNQPFSTTSAVMEQGMQVFLGIYKRVYRSLTKEFRMLYRLNHMFLGTDAYNELLDDPKGTFQPTDDFNPEGLDIVPEADPSLANSMRKQRRVQALIEAQRSGMKLNPLYVTKVFLEAIDEPEVDEAMKQMPQPPSPEELEQKRWEGDMEHKKKELQVHAALRQHQPMAEMAKAMESMAKAKALEGDAGAKEMEAGMQQMLEQNKASMEAQKMIAKLFQDDASHQQKLGQNEEKHQQQMEIKRAQAEAANTNQSST